MSRLLACVALALALMAAAAPAFADWTWTDGGVTAVDDWESRV